MAGAKGPHGFPLPGRTHVFLSKLFGGSMAFWMLYRGKKELPVILVCNVAYIH
ncbi:hypothetical protein C1645_753657 [Glomus cerebriforme]|uniref:Uncharacterized protein n=1 Tax=Glomus cerebriforme TaxID=658196 RepID=A0A397TIV6_9GLOM|nr:hypothetical protein C1645_753657 [Glomus cerebriforme]